MSGFPRPRIDTARDQPAAPWPVLRLLVLLAAYGAAVVGVVLLIWKVVIE
jgi:hypothetical protein